MNQNVGLRSLFRTQLFPIFTIADSRAAPCLKTRQNKVKLYKATVFHWIMIYFSPKFLWISNKIFIEKIITLSYLDILIKESLKYTISLMSNLYIRQIRCPVIWWSKVSLRVCLLSFIYFVLVMCLISVLGQKMWWWMWEHSCLINPLTKKSGKPNLICYMKLLLEKPDDIQNSIYFNNKINDKLIQTSWHNLIGDFLQ